MDKRVKRQQVGGQAGLGQHGKKSEPAWHEVDDQQPHNEGRSYEPMGLKARQVNCSACKTMSHFLGRGCAMDFRNCRSHHKKDLRAFADWLSGSLPGGPSRRPSNPEAFLGAVLGSPPEDEEVRNYARTMHGELVALKPDQMSGPRRPGSHLAGASKLQRPRTVATMNFHVLLEKQGVSKMPERYLGMDPDSDKELLHIAKSALMAPLPEVGGTKMGSKKACKSI
eukprot:1116548-Pelagomonas_calceolata.AAC.2